MCWAEEVSVADCVRDAEIDVWAAADVEFCRKVMGEVFELAGVQPVKAGFGTNGIIRPDEVEVVCSAFRSPQLLENFDFPLQPLGKMHYALYTTPDRAELMLSMKITDWPRMKVAWSPVSQGRDRDRESYFEHAGLSPEYVEFHSSAGAVEALRAGVVDVLFLYTPYGRRPEGLVEIVPIGTRNVYFAVRKDRPELFKRLRAAYREWYIENIERYDAWREEALGIKPPRRRVRVAAYSRGDLFQVSPDGQRSGLVEEWIRSLCAIAHWSPDYVYGDYDESVADVKSGRLDLVGGLGFSPARGKTLEFPHTPIGMLRVYLWARPDSPYQAGKPETWKGMRIGLLGGTLSAQRVKQRWEEGKGEGSTLREYPTDRELLEAYFAGEVDAVVNIEMEQLANERALRLYTSHPMYLLCSRGKPELFRELEEALDVVCEDYPRYSSLVMERHYGAHSEMSEMSIHETEWLEERLKDPTPIVIDFSPWPFPVADAKGQPQGLPKALLAELERHTGLKFAVSTPQTGVQTAEAKFMRGDTDFWVPWPERPDSSAYGAVEVFFLPVPQSCSELYGAQDFRADFELLTHSSTPAELVSILRKTMESIPTQQWTEMFMAAAAGRMAERTFFGLTDQQLKEWALGAAGVFAILVMIYAISFIVLLKRQARLAQEAAHQANEASMAKSRFLAMMSHELRTPLNAVIGFAEFLCQENALESKRREWVHGILASATALLDLINDILDLSKLEIGSMNMRAGKCRVAEVIGELPAIFGHRVKEKGVDFTVHKTSEGNIPALRLSRQGLRQILINLVGNSAKFTQGGRIAVEYGWEAATGTLRVVVRDTGCGISAEKMARLFDPFVQDISSRMYERAGNAAHQGTGLGLPIVNKLVDSAGGTITVDSRLGEGTRFTIEIPGLETVAEEGSGGTAIGAGVHTAEAAPAAAAAAPAKTAKPARIPKTVLVVDDIAMNRKVLGIHLGKLGVGEIRYAENGAKALEALADWTPDIVLSDIWMPEMDGQQLSEAMHADARLSAIPIVAITADVEVDTTHDTKHFAKVLAKPVTGAKIAALFEELAL